MKLIQKNNFITKTIGVAGLTISIILIIYYSDLIPILIDFTEKYISPDHHLKPGGIYNVKMVLFTIILLIALLSVLCFLNLNITGKLYNFLNTFINIESLKRFLFNDELCDKEQLSKYIFIIGTSLGILVHLFVLTIGDVEWEGPMEESSSLLFLFSAILLVFSSIRFKKNLFKPLARRKIILLLIGIAGLFIFIYGEEISWGQRLFGIEAPEFFEEHNIQAETNLHNFINPLFLFIYPAVGVGSFIILCLIWLFPYKKKTYLFNLFIPHPSLFYLVFILACTSFLGESEMYEESLAIFVFLYSIRIFMCLRFPNVGSIAMKEENS